MPTDAKSPQFPDLPGCLSDAQKQRYSSIADIVRATTARLPHTATSSASRRMFSTGITEQRDRGKQSQSSRATGRFPPRCLVVLGRRLHPMR